MFFVGEPVPSPDQVGARLSPEHAVPEVEPDFEFGDNHRQSRKI